VAVTLVVLFHAWPAVVPGGFVGVDSFFVISGYLITGHLVARLRQEGRIGFADFYARRVRRILPAATLTLVVVAVASFVVLPSIGSHSESVDSAWASVFTFNIHLAVEGTHYLNASAPPSPIQNFWSLSVEEQFYALWPFVLVAVVALATRALGHRRRAPAAITRAAAGATAVIFVVSLLVDLRLTRTSPPWAYYSLFSRAWELSVGGALVLAEPFLRRVIGRAGPALAWVGLVALLASALVLDSTTPYPGLAALWPVAATGAVIAGGFRSPESTRRRENPVLAAAPSQAVGRLSYSWYLWHFPALVLVPYLFHRQSLPVAADLLVAALSLGIASLSFHLVERPLRRSPWLNRRPRNALAAGALLVATSLGVSLALAAASGASAAPVDGGRSGRGTGVTATPILPTSAPQIQADLRRALRQTTIPGDLTPSLAGAAGDEPVIYQDGCHVGQPQSSGPPSCVFGDVHSPTTVVLFGDSHAAQWFPALEAISLQEHWRLVSLTKSSCPAADVSVYNVYFKRTYTECDIWRSATLSEIVRLHPALVVLSSRRDYGATTTYPDDSSSFLAAWRSGMATTLRRFAAAHIHALLIDDTPHPAGNVPDCLALHPNDTTSCMVSASSEGDDNDRRVANRTTAAAQGATYLDPTPWFCTSGGCPVIVGSTLVYRDDQHMTVAYAQWLAPLLGSVVMSAMDK
jgi:peptidoglycan/LPS O-acetylase OafA/YrhL